MVDINSWTRVLRFDNGLVVTQELPGLFTVRHRNYIFDWEEFEWVPRWVIDNKDSAENNRDWMQGKFYVHSDRINYIDGEHHCQDQLEMVVSLLPAAAPERPKWFVEGRIIVV